jgi:hypothetical protein
MRFFWNRKPVKWAPLVRFLFDERRDREEGRIEEDVLTPVVTD